MQYLHALYIPNAPNTGVRNMGWTSDIYRPNEAFVLSFVILLDIFSGGVVSGVESRMSNPHPCTFQCHVNKWCFWSLHKKQMQTVTGRTCTVLSVYFVKSRMWALTYLCWAPNDVCTTGHIWLWCATRMQQTATGRRYVYSTL